MIWRRKHHRNSNDAFGLNNKKEREFNYLIQLRNLEVDLFWERYIFLIGIQAIIITLFVGVFSNEYGAIIAIATSIFGICFSFFVLQFTSFNKYWLEFWENSLVERQKYLGYDIFDPLLHSNKKEPEFLLKKAEHIHKTGYRSTKKWAYYLCMIFIIFWIFMLYYSSCTYLSINPLNPLEKKTDVISSIQIDNTQILINNTSCEIILKNQKPHIIFCLNSSDNFIKNNNILKSCLKQ